MQLNDLKKLKRFKDIITILAKYGIDEVVDRFDAPGADFERTVTTVPYLRDMEEPLLPYGTDWAEQWEFALGDFFPALNCGRTDITFYLLPDQPINRLLSLPKSLGVSDGDTAHGLLALLGSSVAL